MPDICENLQKFEILAPESDELGTFLEPGHCDTFGPDSSYFGSSLLPSSLLPKPFCLNLQKVASQVLAEEWAADADPCSMSRAM